MAAGDGTSNGKYAEALERLREIGLLEEPSLLSETCELFLRDAATTLESIKDAFSTGDSMALERAAHRLKGAALNLGLATLSTPARSLEDNARRGEFAGGPESITTLECELAEVGAWLRQVCSAPHPPS